MIGEREDPHEYLSMSKERLRGLEALLSTHITWYTHRNPYGCTICDLLQLTDTSMNSFGEFLGPRPSEQDIAEGKSVFESPDGAEEMTTEEEEL